MQIVISSQGSSPAVPLQLDIPGYRMEVSDIGAGRKLAVSEDSGRITVSIVTAGDVQPAAGEAEPPAVEAQPEAVPAVQQVVEAEAVKEAEPEASPVVRQEAGVKPLPASQSVAAEQELFQHLVALRKQISAEVKLPPYIIFHDVTLKEMSRLLPADLEAMKTIQGVGSSKLEKYGIRFVEAIREFTGAGKAA
jgi:ATP-dependent DNA helicase RecQ